MAILSAAHIPLVTAATTNADPTSVDLFDFAAPGFCEALPDCGLYVEVTVIVRDEAGNAASGQTVGTLKMVSGALTFVSSTPVHLSSSDLAIGSFDIAASGSKLQAAIEGILATNLAWKFHTRVWSD